jgi:DNA replication protein DnaC
MAIIDETVTLCRRLRLKYVREQVSDVMLTARAQRWDPAEALRVLLVAESEGRDRSTIETRRRRAHFPAGKTFASWVETRSSVPAATLQALRGLEWVGRAENVVVAGPQGTGKSHLLEALGHHAVDQGLSVAWFSVEDLGAIIRRHRVDDTVSKAFAALASTSLCVIDLSRPRDYPDEYFVLGGDRAELVGIITGPRGRRAACRPDGTDPAERSTARCAPMPVP